MMIQRLNLGCGRSPLVGWKNVDRFPGSGVDVVLDVTRLPWPFATAGVPGIRANCLWEHLPNWEDVTWECARVLAPGAILEVTVPYRFRAIGTPYEHVFFSERSFDLFCDGIRVKTNVPFVRRVQMPKTLERPERVYFVKVRTERIREPYPFAWHLAQRFGEVAYRWPVARTKKLRFVLKRNSEVWA